MTNWYLHERIQILAMMKKLQIAVGTLFILTLGFFLGFWFSQPLRFASEKFSTRKPVYIDDQKSQKNKFDLQKQSEIEDRKSQEILLPILLYHYVEYVKDEKDTIRKSLSITPAVLESQIQTLLANGYKPIVLSDVLKYFAVEGDLPELPVILTFDDGYQDFYTDVFPLIKKYQIPVEAYVVSGFLNKTKNYLTKEELLEIDKSGLVEIGAHTVHHLNLRFIPEVEAEAEIKDSKKALETLLGHPVTQFAFPYGGYTSKLVEMVGQLGFSTAATTDRGTTQSFANRFVLRRIRPGKNTG